MSTRVSQNQETIAATPEPSAKRIRRTAMYLAGSGEPILAWLHTAAGDKNVDHGVVICPPVGFEQLHAQRSLRHLADAVAERGIPSLRFDWHGTGDSAGSDADPTRRTTWHANVRDVVAWMRTHLGCRRVSVVGLRMGAMLAVEALDPDDCDNLVLWAPVTCGKSYLRQMQSIEKMSELRPRAPDAKPGDVEAAGFFISDETADQFSKLNLLQRQLSCMRGLLVGPFDKRLVDRFAQFDIPVEQISLPGFAEMMAEPHFSQVPRQTIVEIAQWLGNRIASGSPAALSPEPAALGLREMNVVDRPKSGTAPPTTVRERILRIGGDVDLFGILTEPVESTTERPTIVMLNAGAASHVGPGRFNVDLARSLARHGFPCLRLDACGLGESIPPNPTDENNPYPMTVFRDVESALDELRTNYGVKHCVLMGLCSGAYAAFQSTVQLSHSLLAGSVLINPLTFYWQDGMPFDASAAEQVMKEHCYMARAFNPRKLWKFFRGKTEIGYGDALRLLKRRVAHYFQSKSSSVPKGDELPPVEVASHPPEENLPQDLARVAASGRHLAMFLAENDPGYAVMTYHARRQVKEMLRTKRLHLATIPCGDHTFSRRVPREKLVRAIAEYLQHRY